MNPYLQKKLTNWSESGLINDETRNRIVDYENRRSGINVLMAALFMGALTISIGIVSIVAANWHEIPKLVKLLSAILLLSIFSALTYLFNKQGRQSYKDASILLVFGSIISSIALVGQIYHLESHLFNSFALWLMLGTPIVLFNGSKYVTYVWTTVLTICAYLSLSRLSPESGHHFLALPPLTLLGLSLLFMKMKMENHFFHRATSLCGWILLIGSILVMGPLRWRNDLGVVNAWSALINFLAAMPLGIYLNKHYKWQGAAILFLAMGFLEIPNAFFHGDLKVLGALYFLLLFSLLAALALKLEHKKLFDYSCLLLAIRIIFIYFEVFGSLLQTGIGLVMSGLFILFVAWIWHSKKDILWKLGERR